MLSIKVSVPTSFKGVSIFHTWRLERSAFRLAKNVPHLSYFNQLEAFNALN